MNANKDVDDPAYRDVTFDQMVANYYEQIRGLVAGGVDLLLPETLIRYAGAQGLPVRLCMRTRPT